MFKLETLKLFKSGLRFCGSRVTATEKALGKHRTDSHQRINAFDSESKGPTHVPGFNFGNTRCTVN